MTRSVFKETRPGYIKYSCIFRGGPNEKIYVKSLALRIFGEETEFTLNEGGNIKEFTFESEVAQNGVPIAIDIPYRYTEEFKGSYARQLLEDPEVRMRVFTDSGRWYVWNGFIAQCWVPETWREKLPALVEDEFKRFEKEGR